MHAKSQLLAEVPEKRHVARAFVTKDKVSADAQRVEPAEIAGEVANELFAGNPAECLVETDDQQGIDTHGGDGPLFLGRGMDGGRRQHGRDNRGRVPVKRDHDRPRLVAAGVVDGLPDHLLMSEVNAVEDPDGEAGFLREILELGGGMNDLHARTVGDQLARASSRNGMIRFSRAGSARLRISLIGSAFATSNRPEISRRKVARCAPQPSFSPRSWASERT